MPDQRDQLAQMMMGYQAQPGMSGRMPGPPPPMPGGAPPVPTGAPPAFDPNTPMSDWTPGPTSPFGGLDQTTWKQPGTPQQTGMAPIGPSAQDLQMLRSLVNGIRAQGGGL